MMLFHELSRLPQVLHMSHIDVVCHDVHLHPSLRFIPKFMDIHLCFFFSSVFTASSLNHRRFDSKELAGIVYLRPLVHNISCNVDFMCGDDSSAPLKQSCGSES